MSKKHGIKDIAYNKSGKIMERLLEANLGDQFHSSVGMGKNISRI